MGGFAELLRISLPPTPDISIPPAPYVESDWVLPDFCSYVRGAWREVRWAGSCVRIARSCFSISSVSRRSRAVFSRSAASCERVLGTGISAIGVEFVRLARTYSTGVSTPNAFWEPFLRVPALAPEP